MLSCLLRDGSLKTCPGHMENISRISQTFVFFKKNNKSLSPDNHNFLSLFSPISRAACVGLKDWSSSTSFCAVPSSGHLTRAPCLALTTHGMARQCSRRCWTSPVQPHRLDQRPATCSAQNGPDKFLSNSGCTSSSQACKPHSTTVPF